VEARPSTPQPLRVAERLASVALEELGFRVRVERARPQVSARLACARGGPLAFGSMRRDRPSHPRGKPGLDWRGTTLLWRPEGVELRVPLRMRHCGEWRPSPPTQSGTQSPLAGLRREMMDRIGFALASPTLLDDVGDPQELRRYARHSGSARTGCRTAGRWPGPPTSSTAFEPIRDRDLDWPALAARTRPRLGCHSDRLISPSRAVEARGPATPPQPAIGKVRTPRRWKEDRWMLDNGRIASGG